MVFICIKTVNIELFRPFFRPFFIFILFHFRVCMCAFISVLSSETVQLVSGKTSRFYEINRSSLNLRKTVLDLRCESPSLRISFRVLLPLDSPGSLVDPRKG